MSKRSILNKQAARLRKTLRQTPPSYIDIVHYLKHRRIAQTTGEAHKMILGGRVKAAGDVIGRVEIPDMTRPGKMTHAVVPFVPAKFRSQIEVLDAEA